MERPTIPASELPPAAPNNSTAAEWETYRSQVTAWLAQGREGQFVLIKGSEVVGFWDAEEAALSGGYKRFLMQPFLVHQVRSREPLFRIGYNRGCPR